MSFVFFVFKVSFLEVPFQMYILKHIKYDIKNVASSLKQKI